MSQLLQSHALNDGSPRWSPDGCSIIFDSESNEGFEIDVVDLDGQNLRNLVKTPGVNYQQPAWSWKDNWIAFSSNYYEYSPYFKKVSDLFEISVDGKGLRRLTNNPAVDSENSGDTFPVYSPTGNEIAYASVRNELSQIYLLDLDKLASRKLTNDNSESWDPAWSPDGKKIAFVSSKDGRPQIDVIDLESGRIDRISDGKSDDRRPAWSPDGHFILFNADRGDRGKEQIYRMNVEGTREVVRITQGQGANIFPSWSPRKCERITR